ncbi:MAG: hypothetical protein CMF23_04310 [Ignavibacteriae bacterium]|nr:hypothetical protein [Ignavibacteriota bacterium]
MEKKIKNFDSYKKIKISDYYKSDVINRAMERKNPLLKGIFLLPISSFIFSGIAAVLIIFVLSIVNINQKTTDELFEDFNNFNNEVPIEYLSVMKNDYTFDLSDYYEKLSDEEMIEILLEMDSLFENNSSYLLENIAVNSDF